MGLPQKGLKELLFIFIAILISSPCLAQERTSKKSSAVESGKVFFIRNNSIWVFNLKTSQERQITHDKRITSYCVSPDDRLLAYFVDADKLYLYDLSDNKETFLVQIRTDLTNPSFSPKAEQIVLIGYAAAIRHVWLLNITTRKLTDLTSDSEYHHMFVNWSPDGKWISYTSFVNPWWTFIKDASWEVYILDAFDSKHTSYKIGKGSQSKWANKKRLIIAHDKSLGVYDVHSKKLVKDLKADDPNGFGYFSIGPTPEILFYASYNGGEGDKSKVKVYDLKSGKKSELILDAENPTYVKAIL